MFIKLHWILVGLFMGILLTTLNTMIILNKLFYGDIIFLIIINGLSWFVLQMIIDIKNKEVE